MGKVRKEKTLAEAKVFSWRDVMERVEFVSGSSLLPTFLRKSIPASQM
jgi:hypothetical protein